MRCGKDLVIKFLLTIAHVAEFSQILYTLGDIFEMEWLRILK